MAPSLKALAAAAIAALMVFAAYEVYVLEAQPGPFTGQVPTVFTVNGKTYAFSYAATTPAEWASGLMNRKITGNTTMLFAFSSSRIWDFWMYDTNASLDIIWLSATGNSSKVVNLVTPAPPCFDMSSCARYHPSSPANFAIEAKAGFAAANGIAVGTIVELG